jgi:hypothetical protein
MVLRISGLYGPFPLRKYNGTVVAEPAATTDVERLDSMVMRQLLGAMAVSTSVVYGTTTLKSFYGYKVFVVLKTLKMSVQTGTI